MSPLPCQQLSQRRRRGRRVSRRRNGHGGKSGAFWARLTYSSARYTASFSSFATLNATFLLAAI
jgi:hypothetical protein